MRRLLASLLLCCLAPAAQAFELSGSGYYRSDGTYFPFYQAAPVGPTNEWFQPFAPKPPVNPYMVPNWQRPAPGMGWRTPPQLPPPRQEPGPWYRSAP